MKVSKVSFVFALLGEEGQVCPPQPGSSPESGRPGYPTESEKWWGRSTSACRAPSFPNSTPQAGPGGRAQKRQSPTGRCGTSLTTFPTPPDDWAGLGGGGELALRFSRRTGWVCRTITIAGISRLKRAEPLIVRLLWLLQRHCRHEIQILRV